MGRDGTASAQGPSDDVSLADSVHSMGLAGHYADQGSQFDYMSQKYQKSMKSVRIHGEKKRRLGNVLKEMTGDKRAGS